MMREFIVKKEDANNRIDAYLSSKNDDFSRVAIQRLVEEQKILVNGKKTKASYKVQENNFDLNIERIYSKFYIRVC